MADIRNKVKKSRRCKSIVKDCKVQIIAGDHKGQEGTVLKVKDDKVWVTGINLKFKRRNPNQAQENETPAKVEYPVHVSNVRLLSNTVEST